MKFTQLNNFLNSRTGLMLGVLISVSTLIMFIPVYMQFNLKGDQINRNITLVVLFIGATAFLATLYRIKRFLFSSKK